MNGKDNIEEYLRSNKPQVKDDPTFLLETNRRLKSVEGIKAEVDRQRVQGRMALIITLVIGIVIGAVATIIGYLCPFSLDKENAGILASVLLFMTTWKEYFFILLAALSLSLSLLLVRTRKAGF